MDDRPGHTDDAAGLTVACLCAAWCRNCDDYRPVFDRVIAECTELGLVRRTRWIDIEDDETLIGEIDIETFPTLLVFDARGVLFAGPLLPHAQTLGRLLRSLADPNAQAGGADTAWALLAARLN